jgi:hypothetical protein
MDTLSSFPHRQAVIAPMTDGHFKLIDPSKAHPLTPILFNNRKAARNWASGRGYFVRDSGAPGGR